MILSTSEVEGEVCQLVLQASTRHKATSDEFPGCLHKLTTKKQQYLSTPVNSLTQDIWSKHSCWNLTISGVRPSKNCPAYTETGQSMWGRSSSLCQCCLKELGTWGWGSNYCSVPQTDLKSDIFSEWCASLTTLKGIFKSCSKQGGTEQCAEAQRRGEGGDH